MVEMGVALGTTLHQEVTGTIVRHVRTERAVARGRQAEARWILGDAIWLPAFLLDCGDSGRTVVSDSRQVGEALRHTFPSLPVSDVELDLDQRRRLLIVHRNLHHDAGLEHTHTFIKHEHLLLFCFTY